MLLQGVIDSPDIPLNVSRSYLQSDANVKKIASYITKKVSARLAEIAKNDAQNFESKWNDIKIFIQYGMLSDEKFCEAAMKFALLEDVDGKFFKIDDYKTLVSAEQTDKDGNLIVLYASDKDAQYPFIKAAQNKGYSVLLLNGQLDSPFIGMLEQKLEKTRFVRVDSDVIENIIKKEDAKSAEISDSQRNVLTTVFKSQLPKTEKCDFMVSFGAFAENAQPIVITQGEYMRRMKEMAALQPGMSFYGDFPDSYMLTINTCHPVVKRVIDNTASSIGAQVEPLDTKIAALEAEIKAIRDTDADGKSLTEEQKTAIKEKENEITAARDQIEVLATDFANTQDVVKQLVDIALLGNNLLKGEALSNFLARSISLL